MSKVIDTSEWNDIIDILENLSDENLAAKWLSDLTRLNRELGDLILQTDSDISDDDWKKKCDDKKAQIEELVQLIRKQS